MSRSGARYVVAGVRDLYVPDFGAKFDFNGVTGTDDTAAWQAALNQAITTGATLVAPAAPSKITSGLTVTNAQALTIRTPRSGLAGSFNNRGGAWLFWAGAGAGTMLTLAGCQNVQYEGLGLHGNNLAQGILVRSGAGNNPVSTVHTYRDFHVYRATTGVYVNDAGDASQADQNLFESIRMDEIVNNCFTANSLNVSTCRFVRNTTAIAGSATDSVHYNLIRATGTEIVNCNGGYGQDFVRLGSLGQVTTIDGCQVEGSTNPNYAFLRVGATTDGGFFETTVMRGNVVDAPVVLAGPSRTILSQGNLFHSGGLVSLTGGTTRYLSYAESLYAAPTITGANAMFRSIDGDLTNGGNPTTGSAGANGSTAITVTGNTYAGTIAFTTAAGLPVDAYALVVGMISQIGAGYRVSLTPTNGAAAAAQAYVTGKLSSQWELHLHNPPAAATAMTFDYRIG